MSCQLLQAAHTALQNTRSGRRLWSWLRAKSLDFVPKRHLNYA